MIKFPETHPWWLRYAASIFAASAAWSLSWFFVHHGLRLHSSFMLTAVVITAWFGGFGPGILTFALTLPPQILLRDPINLWAIHGPAGWAGFCIYVANALIVCGLFRKRYYQKARTAVSPVAVTGGWMWKLDPADGGTVETHSPEFPRLSVTRTFPMWLETVHPEDRAALEQQIEQAFVTGQLMTKYHVLHKGDEIRLVSMFGVLVKEEQTSDTYLVATCIEVGARENPEHLAWSTLPL
jgi:hypothetical protein